MNQVREVSLSYFTILLKRGPHGVLSNPDPLTLIIYLFFHRNSIMKRMNNVVLPFFIFSSVSEQKRFIAQVIATFFAWTDIYFLQFVANWNFPTILKWNSLAESFRIANRIKLNPN